MSRKNGDRARFGRQRKEKIHKRARIRELRKVVQQRIAADPAKRAGGSLA